MEDQYQLPAGVAIPEKYRNSPEQQKWFVLGVRDGMAAVCVADNLESGQGLEPVLAEAYREGCMVGRIVVARSAAE
jgi:hypothetical protein